jgi:hypothetical protein
VGGFVRNWPFSDLMHRNMDRRCPNQSGRYHTRRHRATPGREHPGLPARPPQGPCARSGQTRAGADRGDRGHPRPGATVRASSRGAVRLDGALSLLRRPAARHRTPQRQISLRLGSRHSLRSGFLTSAARSGASVFKTRCVAAQVHGRAASLRPRRRSVSGSCGAGCCDPRRTVVAYPTWASAPATST